MKPGFKAVVWASAWGVAALSLLTGQRTAQAGWAEDALKSEADYLVNCSFTTHAKNNGQVQKGDAAYGALNNVRLAGGPDWVRPGEGAMAIIGLMAATTQLKASGDSVTTYNAVIDAFFNDWLKGSRAAFCAAADNPNYGGFAPQVVYNPDGSLKAQPTEFNTGVTGAMLCAMWKYYEFNQATGRVAVADDWLRGDAYDIALRGGKFLKKCYNAKYNLVSPAPSGGNLWINDSSLATAGLRCLAQWAATSQKSAVLDDAGTTPAQLADSLTAGLENMKDHGAWKGFFKLLNPANGSRGYDGSLDQLCFVPYEVNALDPAQDFAKSISDFWTDGAAGRRMTYQTDDARRWTYFGTRWHFYEGDNPETDRLTPGAGLQLAKVEWKYARARGDATLRERAMKRFQFANATAFSNLWYGAGGRSEAGVSGGIVNWRHASQPDNTGSGKPRRADEWERFIDTSAYFIEVTLMAFWNKDTKYTPE